MDTRTTHRVFFADSRDLGFIDAESVDLVVTSPPYPMIEMWDDCFAAQNEGIGKALDARDGRSAFELMHGELDKVWRHVHRVLVRGGMACINVGDATRTLGGAFRLYSNHSRILSRCGELGFDVLPLILWRKTTNAPNKFMGSGMLPPSAYVTLEHEYVLVLRKGGHKIFSSDGDRRNRRESAYFWEERNVWFSDVWDLAGARQQMNRGEARQRSAAFPFELAYRLINMFSSRRGTVLDPFLGTGTTMHAAIASERNSIGVEIDDGFRGLLAETTPSVLSRLNEIIGERIRRHVRFIEEYSARKGRPKHLNEYFGFPVVTSHEADLKIRFVDRVERTVGDRMEYRVRYADRPKCFEPDGRVPGESPEIEAGLDPPP